MPGFRERIALTRLESPNTRVNAIHARQVGADCLDPAFASQALPYPAQAPIDPAQSIGLDSGCRGARP
jgi:hypothetical protein